MTLTIPKGTKCELCGMLAEFVEKDAAGVVHYYCSHHQPQPHRHPEAHTEGSRTNVRDAHTREILRSAQNDKVVHHDKHAGHTTNMFKTRFWVCLVLTLPILAYAEIVQKVLGVSVTDFHGREILILALASVIFFYGGWVFVKGALTELRQRLPGMMTLIALAISVAYIYSAVATFVAIGEPLFWEIATLITIMLLGHWIEMAAVGHASGALKELAKLLPDVAERFHNPSQPAWPAGRPPLILRGGDITITPLKIRGDGGVINETETVPISELRVGDLVLVRPGTKIPADGEVVEGISTLNESMITGESKPVDKNPGSPVIAGTVNGEGALKVRVTKVGEATALAGIMRLVAQAQASRSRVQALADRAAFYLTFVAVAVGAITTVVWLALDAGVAVALTRTVAVLVIACPHALGLAVPLVASISTTLSARNGLLVREKLALELARKIQVVLFDKTGTLTKGEYGVTDVIIKEQGTRSKEQVLAFAAAVDQESEHLIAKAIVKAAQERGVEIPRATDIKALPGRGVEGVVDGKKVMVGGENLVRELGIGQGQSLSARTVLAAAQGKTVVYLITPSPQPSPTRGEGEIVAAFAVADVIRPESYEAVNMLHKMGVRVAMVTGDAKPVAQWVAKELGIDEVYAEVLPQDKVEIVRQLQHKVPPLMLRGGEGELRTVHNPSQPPLNLRGGERRIVAFVGDGINDAPALTAADVGIAIGAGTDVAIESAGIVLMRNDPRDMVRIIKLARATYRKMVENLIWATGYNAFAIPAAAGAFMVWGVVLAPAVAAVLMSVSTVIVAFNAQLLRKLRLD